MRLFGKKKGHLGIETGIAPLVFAVLALTACRFPDPSPIPPDATDAAPQLLDAARSDTGADASPVDDCQAAEWRLSELGGCSLPVPFTAAACRRALADGRDWHPRCLAAIASCAQLDDAYRGRFCP